MNKFGSFFQGLFSATPKNVVTAPMPAINSVSMNPINDAVLNHINMQTNGALMITGDWGSGKTYYLKHELFEVIKQQTKRKPMMVSVYGEKDKKSIAERVVFSYFDVETDQSLISTQKIMQTLTRIASAVPKISQYINIEKLLMGNGDNMLKLLPKDELLICFDDVERLSDKMDLNDFLGLVNELVENHGAKVIIIANDKKFRKGGEDLADKKVIYLEKTVEKVIHYLPDIPSVYDHIIAGYPAGPFNSFMIAHRPWLISTIQVEDTGDSDLEELGVLLANIRTIKFAIEHYRLAFEIFTSTKDPNDELVIAQLKSAWLFTLAIAVEFRKGDSISFTDSRHLEDAPFTFGNTSLDELFAEIAPAAAALAAPVSGQAEDPSVYTNKFKKLYYDRLGEQFRFYRDIYDLVTGGQTIGGGALTADIDQKFNSHDGEVSPAHRLLQRIVTEGYASFSNAEFPGVLAELKAFTENGNLEDLQSYFTTGNILVAFAPMIPLAKAAVITAVRSGIDKFLPKLPIDDAFQHRLSMVLGSVSDPDLLQLGDHILEEINVVRTARAAGQVAELNALIADDPLAFSAYFIPENLGIRTPAEPILHEIDLGLLTAQVPAWEPKAIHRLADMLEVRYNQRSFIEYITVEKVFLDTLDALSPEQFPENSLSKFTFKQQLKPQLKEAKANVDKAITAKA